MKTQFHAWAFGAVAGFLLMSCSNDDVMQNGNDDNGTIQRIVLTEPEYEMIAYYNDFAWRLYSQIISQDPQENKVISPLSISLAIGMLANGASDEALDEIMSVFGLDDSSIDRLNSVNAKFASGLEQVDSKVNLSLANSFWYDASTIHPYATFCKALSDNYNAESIGFEANPTQQINSWIEKKTNGLIKNMISDDNSSLLYLINATYFKGMWTEDCKFDPKNTKTEKFHNYSGSISSGKFMQNTSGGYQYRETETAQHVALAIGSENKIDYETFSFNVILPKEESSIEKSLQEMMTQPMTRLYNRQMTLHIPKFDVSFKSNIIGDLQQMGLKKVFNSNCDGIANENIIFSSVRHGASVSIDEDGTTAAAATIINGDIYPGEIDFTPIEIILDRPFVYYITEHSTGAILFIGHIAHL